MATSRKMKYIVVEGYSTGISSFTMIFPFHTCIQHVDFAKAILSDQSPKAHVVSAGFCYSPDRLNQASAFGESVSLDLKSRPKQDTELLRSLMEDDY